MNENRKAKKTQNKTNTVPYQDFQEERFRSLFMECPISLWEEDITELIIHLEELKNSGVKDIRSYFLNHPDEVVRCTGLIKIIGVNKATLALYEAPDEQSLLASLSLIFTDESFGTMRDIVIALFEGKMQIENEGINRTLGGNKITVSLKWSLLPDSGGKLTRILLSVVDVTDRKQIEEERKNSAIRLSRAQDMAHVGDWEWDIPTNAVYWSDELYRIYGFQPYEITPDYGLVLKQMHHDCRDEFLAAINAALNENRHFEMDYRFHRKDGTIAELHTIGQVLRNASGEPEKMVGTVQDLTVLREAESRLHASEDRFRSIFENVIDGIMIADAGTKLNIEANKAICSMMGYTRDELLHLHPADLHPKDALTDVLNAFERQLRGEISLVEGVPMLRKDGSIFYADINAVTISLGGRQCLIGIFRDISERRKTEAALKERENQLAESQRIAHIGSWEHNLTTGKVVWSDELFRLLGLNPRKDPGDFKIFFEMVHPDDRPVLKSAIEETIQTGNHFSIDYRLNKLDGSTRTLHVQAELIRDETNKEFILSGTAQDITERKTTEEKIRQSEEFIRGILDTVDEGFIVIDHEYRIMNANKAYCAQVNLPVNGVIGKKCYNLSHKSSRPCYETDEDCAVFKVFATGMPQTALHKHKDEKGNTLFVETKAFPVKDTSGLVTSVIETINNITERHLLEEERLKTQKLESIGILAGGIAHDFNNLLQGVFGYISLAKLTYNEREKSLAMLGLAEQALNQSVNLTSQLLTFSKGGKPLKKNLILGPIIDTAAKFALSGSRSVYNVDIEQNLWQADADSGQIGQVIHNIVLNADQAMPEGGRILITARNLPASETVLHPGLDRRDYVMIEIEDNGMGIPEEFQNKIFDPYFTTKKKGSGLGLATSYSIIKNHDGRIEVQSQVGSGSVFRIYLPTSRADKQRPAERPRTELTRKIRVLVMDDEEIIRRVVQELLRSLGHDAEVTDNGDTTIKKYALAQADGNPFDVVILDLTIRGGRGGAETLRALLEIDPYVRAVVSSGYSNDQIIATYRKHGFRAFLKKPYNIEDLTRILNETLS